MRLRRRLSLAFFLISVLPLALVTAYSYYSSAAALRKAVEAQADQMAADMGDRMTWVMADLGDRVERLWRMRIDEPAPAAAAQTAAAQTAAAQTAAAQTAAAQTAAARTAVAEQAAAQTAAAEQAAAEQAAALQGVASMMLAEAAPLVRRLEFSSAAAATAPVGELREAPSPPAPPSRATGAIEPPGPPPHPRAPGEGRGRLEAPPFVAGGRERAAPPGSGGQGRPGRPGVSVIAPGMPPLVIDLPARTTATGQATTDLEGLSPEAVNAWRRAIQRQVERETQLRLQSAMPAGPSAGSPAGRRPGSQAGPRSAGPRMGAPELPPPSATAARADWQASQAAERDRRAEERRQRLSALARGESLRFAVKRDGQVVGQISATVDRDRMMETVLSLGRRERGEVAFVLDAAGAVHTVDAAAQKTLAALNLDFKALASHPSSATETVGDSLIVTRRDESGIVFGLVRPMRETLRDMRRSSLANLAVGLLLIGAAFAVIVPLASRLTRHIATLTDGVQRLARGERGTRVPVGSRDEIGELARAFNGMAAELESHEKVLIQQERLRRELELCRQIQNEMLPHGPLRMGLTEVAGVSIPAREVGGDFFNYFALQDGSLALLVGDVSGKGVGAALLMANIQATLRARLPLEPDLATLADVVDRDVGANTPPEVYLTLFVARLDPTRRTLHYVNAGHNPQFVLRTDGRIDRLGATGMPIGLMPGYGFEERAITVGPGDLLFLYTDGAVEVPNVAGDFFDFDRLEQALVGAASGSIAEVLARVESVIREFRGDAEPFDDATMMALRIAAP